MQKSQSVWAVFEQSPVALAGVPQCSSAKVKYICCLPRPNTPAIIRASAAPRVAKVIEILLFVWQNGKSGYKCRFRFFFYRMVNPYGKFSEPDFPQHFAKNDRQDLKMSCTDAPRRPLQSVLKIGV